LTKALEGIADSARRVKHVRQTFWLGIVYPLIVFSITYCLFLFMLGGFLPRISDAYKGLQIANLEWLHWMADHGRNVNSYYVLPLFVILAVFLVQWFRTRAAKESPFSWGGLPTAGYVRRLSQIAVFAETLSLLIDQDVPLDEAVSLAGRSLGKCRLRDVAVSMSERLQRGERILSIDEVPPELPALLGWLIMSGQSTYQLKKATRKAADNYRVRSIYLASWMAVYIPVLLSVAIGGTTVLFYCVVVYGSLTRAMYELAEPFR
jgi:type II secretory pathway component PulF